jgi:phospholipid/cholesterol/gamma-HCH transport system substrate-binding protein
MQRSVIETVIGAVVLAIAVLFVYFTYSTGYQKVEGYDFIAKFNRVDGISVGSDVRLSGIKVGSVVGARLDPTSYLAVLTLRVDRSIKLPVDTIAKITSDSLLGGNYVAVEPGGEDKLIPPGGQIQSTQDPVNISDLIGRFIFGGASGAKPPAKGQQQPSGQQPSGQQPGNQPGAGQKPQGQSQPSSGQ